MKKVLIALLVFSLIIPFAFAETTTNDLGYSHVGTGTTTVRTGIKIQMNRNDTLQIVEKPTQCTSTKARLLDSSKNDLTTAVFVGNNATFNYNLTYNTVYYIVINSDGASYTHCYDTGFSFPTNFTSFNIPAGLYDTTDNTDALRGIAKVTMNNDSWTITPTPSDSSIIDLLFRNSTGTYTNTMGGGEDFSTFINWTNSTGTPLNSSGVCNVTFVNSFVEEVAADDNFTVCTSGCDYVSYLETFNDIETTNALQDYNYFYACHEQVASGILYANISCASGSYRETISAIQMPLCSEGNAIIRVNSSVCIGDSDVSIKVNGKNSPYSQRKRIISMHYDRQYSIHTENASYNDTSLLWGLPEPHEYYEWGNRTIYANCSYPPNSTFDNSTSETIIIINAAPQIFFGQVNTVLGITALEDNVVIEYAAGIWNWFGSIVDTNPQVLNVTWYNSSGYILFSFQGSPFTTELNTSDGLFIDFSGNPFSINVTVNDSFGIVINDSLVFNVTDTTSPVCDFANDSVLWNEVYYFDNTCTDESFFSLNVTCDNGFNFSATGLNVTSYNFLNQTTMEQDNVTCTARWCDGHTGELSLDWDVNVKDNKFTFNQKNTLEINTDSSLSYEKMYDRVKFTFEMPKDLPANLLTKYKYTYTFAYTTKGRGYYFESEKYRAWIVDSESETWFDLNGVEGEITVKQLDDSTFEIKVMTDQTKLEFQSIGELNCVEREFMIEAMEGMISCQYDSTPYIKTGIGVNNRHLIPVLCQITGGTNQTYKCTSKVKNEDYLLQTNPEPLAFDQDIFRIVEKRNYGYFTAQKEGSATQNVLLYYTNKGLRNGLNATVFADCVSGSTLLSWNANITPEFKSMGVVIDVLEKGKDNIFWVILTIFTLLCILAVLVAVVVFVRKRFETR